MKFDVYANINISGALFYAHVSRTAASVSYARRGATSREKTEYGSTTLRSTATIRSSNRDPE